MKKNSGAAEQMRQRFSYPERVVFFDTTLNEAQLRSLQKQIMDLPGNPVNHSYISLADNKVVVGIGSRDSKLIKSILAIAPDHIEVKAGSTFVIELQ